MTNPYEYYYDDEVIPTDLFLILWTWSTTIRGPFYIQKNQTGEGICLNRGSSRESNLSQGLSPILNELDKVLGLGFLGLRVL